MITQQKLLYTASTPDLCALSRTFLSAKGILKHLTLLEAAGLVAAVHQQGREKRYTLTPEPLSELEQWIKELSARWDKRLLRLKTMLENEQPDDAHDTEGMDAQILPPPLPRKEQD